MTVFGKKETPNVRFCDGCGSICDERCCAREVRERTLERAIELRLLSR